MPKQGAQQGQRTLDQVSNFDQIDKPGAYMTPAGELLRITGEVLKPGHSPAFDVVTRTQGAFTLLDEDPHTPIGKLRNIASDADLRPNF